MLGGLAAGASPLLLPAAASAAPGETDPDTFAAFVTAGSTAAGNIPGIGIDPSYVDGRVD
jgi:hypothetical protein